MPSSDNTSRRLKTSRRDFLQKSAAMVGTGVVASLPLSRSVHAAGSGLIKFGLIGCGGRGSGAAMNAMNAGKDVRLVAMADLYESKLKGSRDRLRHQKGEQVAVDDAHCFVGFDAYQKVLASDIDAVVIACTSHFHPAYLKAAIDAGKQTFCEKPHSLDPIGLKSVKATCETAKAKGLSVVSGLHNRYDPAVRETIQRIHDGAIGDVVTIQESYAVPPYHVHQRKPEWSEIEWQLNNWYHFNWLAGDQCLQQLIHSIDKAAWVLHDKPPVQAWGVGGRAACFGPQFGDMFDHQSIIFEYENNVRVYGICCNQVGSHSQMLDEIYGTKGYAVPLQGIIKGETNWRYQGPRVSPYDEEHRFFFQSIRDRKPINNGEYMVGTTMLAIMAQMVCHTGKRLTWDQVVNSKYSVAQDRYGFDMEPPVKPKADGSYAIAIPGLTPFA